MSGAICRTRGLFQAAHKHAGETLKRFVLLGSAVAVLDSFEDSNVTGRDYTEKDWNLVNWRLDVILPMKNN